MHVGSQVAGVEPFVTSATLALELAAECAGAGHTIESVNLGGGFAVDYEGAGHEPDLAALASTLAALPGAVRVRWCFEPGRSLVAAAGTLVAEVLWDKRRDDDGEEHRFVVLAVGMNDLLRPALYGARHRIVPLAARGVRSRTPMVGPVCRPGPVRHQRTAAPIGTWRPRGDPRRGCVRRGDVEPLQRPQLTASSDT